MAHASPSWIQPAVTGAVIAFVGYAGSVAVVVQGLAAAGASPAEIASALLFLAVAKAAVAIFFSCTLKMPVSIAWSTPGMALLAGTGAVAGGFSAVVGAFVLTGVLILATGLWGPLGRLIQRIPAALANGMLAGILLPLCLAPVLAVEDRPLAVLTIVAVWLLVGRWVALAALPAAAVTALLLTVPDLTFAGDAVSLIPRPVFVPPSFTVEATLSIALPLYLVTMASQNIPGFAVMGVNGYRPAPGPLFLATGGASAVGAVGGMPTINLAAITAALACGPDAGPDPDRRWIAGAVSGVGYLLLGSLAGVTAALATDGVPILMTAVAGLALLGALGNALQGTLADPDTRTAGLVTLLIAASGIAPLGIGSALWALIAGGIVLAATIGNAAQRQ